MEEKNSEKKERKMRDSGDIFIGKVPENWTEMRLKYLCNIQTGNEDTQNANPEGKYPFYVRSPIIEKCDKFTFDGEGILVAGDGAGAGRIFHHAYGKYAVHQRVYRLSDFKYNSDFIYYFLSSIFPNEMNKGSAQSTVPSIRLPMLLNFTFYLPPADKVQLITDFLDSKCSEIDALIENLRARMESSKEYKKAVITEAVTKGLDKDAKMKDSGVEWIGEIPEGWKVCKVKQISNKITDGAHVSPDTTNGEFKFLSVTNMNDTGALDFVNCLKINNVQYAYLVRTGCQPKKDDVLISKDGTIGKTTVVSDNNFVVASSLVIIRPNQLKIRPKYLEYSLMSNIVQEQLLSVLSGSALKRVSIEKNANLKFVYTYDMTTQQQIIDYLDSKCAEIDALLQNYEDQIATLEEYKKSLIYEYVTGKKEVPAA